MKFPNLNEEKKLWKNGCKFVAGLDEVGRGPLAGPVVAGAVVVYIEGGKIKLPKGVKDSKKVSEKKRKHICEEIKNNPNILWGIGIVSEKVIDKINILEATKLAMKKALQDLEEKYKSKFSNFKIDYLLLDGNFKINSNVSQKSVVKGDCKIFSCAAASIIAKVERDKIMDHCHKKYSKYGFDRNKGYGTKAHFDAIKKFGVCKMHRKTFYPCNLSTG